MNKKSYLDLEQVIIDEALKLSDGKRNSYADVATDVLSNFKKSAERAGITKYQIWLNFFEKHVMSVENAIKGDPEKPIDYSENLRGRIKDMLNYVLLFAGLLEEDGLLAVNTNPEEEVKPDGS